MHGGDSMKLLFLCTHNACRSILAEAITRKIAGDRLVVASAGSHPAGRVHPLTLKHLQQRNYSIEGLASQSWDDLKDFEPDIVITVCDSAAGETCPLWFGNAVKAHWGLPDPTSQENTTQVDVLFEQVINRIERRTQAFMQIEFEQLSREQLKSELNALGDLL
jgi:arsenate reductase